MATFESALDTCLKLINDGQADVETCLKLYPEYADQLKPLLETAARLKSGAEAEAKPAPPKQAEAAAPAAAAAPAPAPTPPPAAAASAVPQFTDSHQRRRRGLAWYATPGIRWAALVLVVILGILLFVTAFAQTSYPGDFLYGWKRITEDAVRPINPVLVDLALSQRRANEVLAVRNDPAKLAIAWAGYREVMNRLLAYKDPTQAAHIAYVLRTQWESYIEAGVPLPTGTAALPPVPTASPTPTATQTALATAEATFPSLKETATSSGGASEPTSTPTKASFSTPKPPPTWTPFPTRTPFPTFTPFPSPTSGPSPTFHPPPTLPPPPTNCPFGPPLCP
jgi:hypothetical protein